MPLNQEIRTGEIDEILGKAPGSLVRWGISVFFAVIILIIAGSWFFKYPDTIIASIEITGDFPPVEVKTKVNGKIDSIFVQNNQKVHKNQVLGIMENPADYSEVLALKKQLDSILPFNQKALGSAHIIELLHEAALGELQPYYSGLVSAWSAFRNFIEMDYHRNKIAAAQRQLNDHRVLYTYTYEQRNTLEKDYQLALKDYKRYEKLFEDEVIPQQELERSQSAYLSKKLSFQGSRTSLANLQILISQLESSITELEMQQRQQHESLYSVLLESERNLSAQLDIWEQRYVLRSPQFGNCVFTRIWAKDQNLNANETVFTILPSEHGNVKGTMLIPLSGAGKVEKGHTVNIKLEKYPYMEFGMLVGSIESISEVPELGMYYATVTFPAALTTTYGKELLFNQRLSGSAEIVTKDSRLLHRILQPLKHILFNKT
jgi:multidrug resistance efflux pump